MQLRRHGPYRQRKKKETSRKGRHRPSTLKRRARTTSSSWTPGKGKPSTSPKKSLHRSASSSTVCVSSATISARPSLPPLLLLLLLLLPIRWIHPFRKQSWTAFWATFRTCRTSIRNCWPISNCAWLIGAPIRASPMSSSARFVFISSFISLLSQFFFLLRNFVFFLSTFWFLRSK